MGKISIYILFLLVYFGLSKSFSSLEIETSTRYIKNELYFPQLFSEKLSDPVSLILVDQFAAGFLFKTYFQKYLLVRGFKDRKFITIKTSRNYYNKSKKYIGLSIFRINPGNYSETVPLPPGSEFIGQSALGGWIKSNSGEKKWRFHNAYQAFFSNSFLWHGYKASYQFMKQIKISQNTKVPFFGLNNEFGPNGEITKSGLLKLNPHVTQLKELKFSKIIQKYLKPIPLTKWNLPKVK